MCSLGNIGGDCWTGLSDRNNEGSFEWTDGTVTDFGNAWYQYPWESNPQQPDSSLSNADCVALKRSYGYDWDDQECTKRRLICNKPSEICFQNNWIEVSGGQYFSWSSSILPRSGCFLTDDQSNNQDYHQVSMDITNRNWYVITIGYTFKIDSRYLPGRVGIYVTIAEYDTSRTNTLWIGWQFVADGCCGQDAQQTFIEIDDCQTGCNPNPQIFNDNMDYIFDGCCQDVHGFTGYRFMELIIRLDSNRRLTAKLWQGNTTWDMKLNDVDLTGYLPTNYYIQDVGIKNYQMGTTAKAFHINGAVNPNPPSQAPTSAPTDPTSDPTSDSNDVDVFCNLTWQTFSSQSETRVLRKLIKTVKINSYRKS